MLRAPLVVLASVSLFACSREAVPEPPAPPEPPAAPAPPQTAAPENAPRLIGTVDDPQGLRAFLLADAIASRAAPPAAVVARTIEGGPDHPRITVVYMADPIWCGSGGCALLVLEPGRDGLTQLSRTTLSHPPVRALKTRTNGMPDLSVRVRADYYPGDGPKFVALPFNGRAYALNPTVPPARLLREPIDGEVVISEADVATAFRR